MLYRIADHFDSFHCNHQRESGGMSGRIFQRIAAGSDVWTLYWHVRLWLSAVRVSDRYRQSHFLQRGYYISCINDRCGRFVLRMLYVHFRLYDSRQIECAVLSEENHFTGGGIYCHYCDFPLQNHIDYY